MSISAEEINELFEGQNAYFKSGVSYSYPFRKKWIRALRKGIKKHEQAILDALYKDLGKPDFEAYGSELGFLYEEIRHCLLHLKDWMQPKRVPTSIAHFPTRTEVLKVPKGQVLILAPWNYPFMLLMSPLLSALAAGNTAMLKLPSQTPETSRAIEKMIEEIFPKELVCCLSIEDDRIIPELVQGRRFDHIFFTGSTRVGKLIMKAAAEQLIPLTLELGGKSPAIVDASANLKVAARRIIWGKAFNAGQTCVAPDHVLVESEVYAGLMHHLEQELERTMVGYGGLEGFPRIVNLRRFETLLSLLKGEKDIIGGDLNADELKLGLCIIEAPRMESALMKEEIFGPILPVIPYRNEEHLLKLLAQNPNPLSFYLFSASTKKKKRYLEQIPFGGGCINNCLIHLTSSYGPFGGVGSSGIGQYHGLAGFDAMSHSKTVMRSGTWIDIPVRYVPYRAWKMRIIRALFG